MHHRDEILDELHRVREQMLQEAGGTLEGLFAKIREAEAQETRPLVSRPPRPVRRPEDRPAA